MTSYHVEVHFSAHGVNEENARTRLAQRLEMARLVRPAGTPPEPGAIESWWISDELMERARDLPGRLVQGQTGDPLVKSIETEVRTAMLPPDDGYIMQDARDRAVVSTEDLSTLRTERSGDPAPSAIRGPQEPSEFIGVRTMRRSLVVLTARRNMPDGSPCWCVNSADMPHEGWIHGAACLELRNAVG